ncbi:unnamed protein product, partial [Mycena citricolor]
VIYLKPEVKHSSAPQPDDQNGLVYPSLDHTSAFDVRRLSSDYSLVQDLSSHCLANGFHDRKEKSAISTSHVYTLSAMRKSLQLSPQISSHRVAEEIYCGKKGAWILTPLKNHPEERTLDARKGVIGHWAARIDCQV